MMIGVLERYRLQIDIQGREIHEGSEACGDEVGVESA
jgi:hypothetical protein